MKQQRIGPAMRAALSYLERNGGVAKKIDVAFHVGPHHSLTYGYKTVNRLVGAGLAAEMRPLNPQPWERGVSIVLL